MIVKCFVFVVLISFTGAYNEDYRGYRLYNVKFHTQHQEDHLHKLKSDIIDFVRKPSMKYGVVGKALVPPSHFDFFEERLQEMNVTKDIYSEDVEKYLNGKLANDKKNRNDEIQFDFERYHRYDTILNHLYTLQDNYADTAINFNVLEHASTEEGRPLVYLQISTGNENTKPVAIVEAALSPREWITIPSALNIATRLLEDSNRALLDQYTWIVIPVLNPDGYEYTHTNLRLWTKSMSLNSHLGFICPGVNLNRNFGIDWQISDSSSSPCSHLYAGTEPFSEIETQLIRDLLLEHNPRLYISLRNNGRFITFPWSYERAATGLFRRHYLLGLQVIQELEGYVLDAASLVMGDRESGTSTDYARANNAFYTFNVGVEGTGSDGVIVPEQDIRNVVNDVWRVVAAIARNIR